MAEEFLACFVEISQTIQYFEILFERHLVDSLRVYIQSIWLQADCYKRYGLKISIHVPKRHLSQKFVNFL